MAAYTHRVEWPAGGFWVGKDHTLPAPPDDQFINAYCLTCHQTVNVTLRREEVMQEQPWKKEFRITIGWNGFKRPVNGWTRWDYGGWDSETGRHNVLLTAWWSFGPRIHVSISRSR